MAVLALVFSMQTSAPARAAGLSFAAQAERAGLNSQQAKALQSKVDRYLKTMGGSQVSANEIDFKGGKLTVALPGEAHPRDFTSGAGRLAATDHCAHYYDANGYFCAYEGSNFTGDELQWSACGVIKNINFHHGGSWRNNQTRDQVATMYDKDWNVLKSSLAPEKDANGDWYHVWHMQLC
ncbi:peptidase inhibitor family I36 protein [Streptomyces sp. NPDC059680]|uniref:peptidase inhibitor family I36 protein n=1 Tax=Streptomyces TaxID=1883 RepID=UPI001E29E218|nr:peptidase inhibitor family I36 protein [Streptomyces barringtoniae]MCC5480987.1 peptidase inhibitor family I36 protein [Streptomyces barringtoniae]